MLVNWSVNEQMALTFLEIVMLVHGFIASIALMAATLMVGVLLFSKELNAQDVSRLKWISLGTAFLVFVMDFIGGYGYTFYRARDPTSARSIILATAPWGHEVFFESMEYISLIGPLMATAIAYVVWHYGGDMVKEPAVKRALLIMLLIGILWGLALIGAGVIPTRISAVR